MEASNEKLHTYINQKLDQLYQSPSAENYNEKDEAIILNLCKLFPLLNEPRLGAERFSQYLKIQFKGAFDKLQATINDTKGPHSILFRGFLLSIYI